MTAEEKREQSRIAALKYYYAHREQRLEAMRKWREDNRELMREIGRRTRQKRLAENPQRDHEIARRSRLKHLEKNRAYVRNWQNENREKARELSRKWYADNREDARRLTRKRREADPERVRAQERKTRAAWAAKNPDKAHARREARYQRKLKWQAAHPDEARERAAVLNASRRARRVATPGDHTRQDIRDLYKAQAGKCATCDVAFPTTGKQRYHLDHIYPLKPRKGFKPGSNGPENLRLLCGPCNRSKGNLQPAEWAARKSARLKG